MAFRQEQFDMGLAATALGALVLFALVVGGVLVLGRLGGNALFGTNIESADPFDVLALSPMPESEPITVEAPTEAALPPVPAAPAPDAPAGSPFPPPLAPPAQPPVPAQPPPNPPVQAPSPLPEVPPLDETLDDPVGAVVGVTTNTVEPAGSTLENLLDGPLDRLFGDDRSDQPAAN